MERDTATGGHPSHAPSYGVGDQLRTVCNTALAALLVVDDSRRYLLANAAAAKLFGAPVEEIHNRRIEDFTPSDALALVEPFWADFAKRGEHAGSGELLRRDGSRRPVEYRAARDVAPGQHLIALRELPAGASKPSSAAGRGRPLRLTARELEVLQLAAEGHSTSEIGEALEISPTTVKTHFEHIYKKLGVGDRVAAVARSLRAGLID